MVGFCSCKSQGTYQGRQHDLIYGAVAHQDIIPIPVRGEFSQESFERIYMY